MLTKLKNLLFSSRLMALLFVVFAFAMGIGTFIESMYSTETARIWIYNAKWFEAIMVFFVINFAGNISKYRLLRWEKWPVLLLHLSWVLIIIGAFITRYISFEGMMPITEGNTENVFFSSKTYLTVFVDGEIDGVPQRKIIEDDLIVTEEALKSNLPWKYDYKGQGFTISYVDFIRGVKEGLVIDDSGKEYLKIVEAGDGQRHDHYIESGTVTSIHNILFALNKTTDGAINIFTTDSTYQIKPAFNGGFMRMADQFQGEVIKDSLQPLQLRSLYNMADMQFVIPDSLVRGVNGIVALPENEINKASLDALIVDITTNGETVQKKLIGGLGTSNFSEKITIDGLDFSLAYGSKVYELPFSIKLNDFIAEKYPGTESSYASFMSKVTVIDDKPFDYDIYMNHVLDNGGYRFFQASFTPDEKGTVLSVSHDFWGKWVTYAGYTLLYIGLLGMMLFGKTHFKDLIKSLKKLKDKKAAMTSLLVLMMFSLNAQITTEETSHEHATPPTQEEVHAEMLKTIVSKEHAAKFAELVIQDNGGRMKPMNTYSSELLRKLSLTNTFDDLSSDQVFISMMLNPQVWYNTEFLILDKKSKNDSIREIIGVPADQEKVKATDFFDEKGAYKLRSYVQEAYKEANPNQFQKDFKEVDLRLGLLDRALTGNIIKIFPLMHDENNKWISAVEYRGGQYHVPDSLYGNFIKNALPFYLMTVQKAISTGDYTEADKLLAAFKQNQINYGSEVMPSENKIKTEVIYNKLDIFNRLYKYYAIVGVLMFFILIFQIYKDREIWKIAVFFFKGLIVILFIWHTAGLILRAYVSGHAPWTDAYESILLVSWATMALGMIIGRKNDLALAAITFIASLFLWIDHQSWVDPAIANLVPVLDSYWLKIHVVIIVGSYGPLSVGMILGVTCLILMILTTKKNKKRMEINIKMLTIINELALTVGLTMLTIGNFLGGQWANESWGRYWGWDPKETWALVSIMVYAFVLHMRLVPGLRGRWTFNFLSVFAYCSIMMTYFGVNYYLVGLHSYAQSGSAVVTPDFVPYILLGIFGLGAISYWKYKINYSK